MSQPHYLVILDPRRAHDRAVCIHADRHEADDDVVRFFRGTRQVYGLPANHVVELERHDDQRAAQRARDTFLQRKAGAASFDVAETAVVPLRRRSTGRAGCGAPAEGITAVIHGEAVVRKR